MTPGAWGARGIGATLRSVFENQSSPYCDERAEGPGAGRGAGSRGVCSCAREGAGMRARRVDLGARRGVQAVLITFVPHAEK